MKDQYLALDAEPSCLNCSQNRPKRGRGRAQAIVVILCLGDTNVANSIVQGRRPKNEDRCIDEKTDREQVFFLLGTIINRGKPLKTVGNKLKLLETLEKR